MRFSFKKLGFLPILLIIVLIFILLNIFQQQVKSFFYFFSAPIQKHLWKTGDSASDFLDSVVEFGSLKGQMENLQSENQNLLQQLITLNDLKEENRMLKQSLDIGLEKEFELELAQVIGKDISQDSILIDKGSLSGLSEGMPVITEEKALIGRVSKVYDNFSKVALISEKKFSFDVKIQRENENISGIIKGKGNLNIVLDLIKEDIREEDIVLTSSMGNIFPESLLVGKVKTIKESEIESLKQAEVYPFFNISQMEDVFVILKF